MPPSRIPSRPRGPLASPFGVLLCALLGAGCAQVIEKDETSPYYPVPVGSLFRLHQSIEVPPERTRVFIQGGQTGRGFDNYRANCNIEVRKRDDQRTQRVAAGDYPIVEVRRTLQEVVQAQPVQVAAQGPLAGPLLASQPDSGGMMVYQGYHLWLGGPDPNLMRLSCRGVLADLSEARPPSIQEIRQALGDLASLELATGP